MCKEWMVFFIINKGGTTGSRTLSSFDFQGFERVFFCIIAICKIAIENGDNTNKECIS